MAGNTFGNSFRITTFGESHGAGLGVIIDGCPAGLPLSEADIQPYMDRRKPGQNLKTTQRKEADRVEILSGVFEGQTTGTPIAMLVRNGDQHSKDYSQIAEVFRPGHADFGFYEKYGLRDYRGGGRSSGRETLSRVAAGAVAAKLLASLGIQAEARCIELAGIDTRTAEGQARADEEVLRLREQKDSTGGVVECRVQGLPAGLGEPVFDKLDAKLAQGIMSIGAVKAVEIGDGCSVSRMHGSEDNDGFQAELLPDGTKTFSKKSNHAGGILGGMSDGGELLLRAYFKPTPSIAQPQETANEKGENLTIEIQGRHDPTVAERATVVVECMTLLTLADALLTNMTARMDYVRRVYGKE